jgi:preprotein translocase subunit YajC
MKLNWTTLTLAQAQTESPAPSLPPSTGATPQAATGGNGPGADTSAADTATNGTNPPPATPQGPGGLMQFLLPALLAAMVLMFIFSTRKQKKQQAERKAMIDALKKGDKVQTIGGIRGTVVETREDEIVVKVDENSNTKMRFARSAVNTVLDSKDKGKDE